MASLIVRKLNTAVITLDDIGLSITGTTGTEFDLLSENANDISLSTDLVAAIGVSLEVLDPRDSTTLLSTADGILVIQNHNLSHYGIQGGRFSTLDAPGFTPTDNFLVEFNSGTAEMVQIDPATVIQNNSSSVATIIDGMFVDGTDTTVNYDPTAEILVDGQDEALYDGTLPNGSFVGGDGIGGGSAYVIGDEITLSDNSVILVDAVDANGDVTAFTVLTSGATNLTPGVPLTQIATTSATGTLFTLTPQVNNISDGTISIEVNDSYLRNNGDTLDSGTLNIASGATLNIVSGGSLTIQDAPVNGVDAANKDYVDSVAAGLDPKESVRYCTIADVDGTYAVGGGSAGTGEFTLVDLTDTGIFDGLTAGALMLDERILVKAQPSPTQNGIYVVTLVGPSGTIERATDQDGSNPAEVSSGNFTFVENGTTCAGTGWVVLGDGELILNSDPLTWVQFSESSTLGDGIGISTGGNNLDLDLADTLGTGNAIDGADLIGFHDQDGTPAGSLSGSQTYARTFTDMLNDLNIVNNVAGTGILVQTAPNTYVSRTLAVDGAGPLDGLALTNADGTAGNPTFGFDIQNLPIQTAIDPIDRIPVWDSTTGDNVYYTVSDVAASLSSVNSFETWLGGGNTTGDVSIVADNATDSATLAGGRALNIAVTAASDTLTLSVALTADMVGTIPATGSDSILFFDDSNGDIAEVRTLTSLIVDLGITTNIAAATDEDLLGIDVSGNDIGFNIDGLTNPVEILAATDEFPLHNKSEGTSGANRKITGQEIADGVSDILGIDGITISTINSQMILTITDTTRGNKQLSSDSSVFNFGENSLGHLDWIRIGNAVDADSGHIMPLDGTVVMVTAHCENTNGNSKGIHLFIEGSSTLIGTLSTGANAEIINTTVNIDFVQGDKIRLQAQDSGSGNIADTVANVFVRWRA